MCLGNILMWKGYGLGPRARPIGSPYIVPPNRALLTAPTPCRQCHLIAPS